MQILGGYVIAMLILLGSGYFIIHFPSDRIIRMFLPAITQHDLQESPYKDYSGLKAGENIPRLQGMSQYDDGTYTGLDFVTVETNVVIPLDAYRVKDPADLNNTSMYIGGGRAFRATPLKEYTTNPTRREYLYGRYYILGLADGGYIAVYADQSYGTWTSQRQKVTFPIGRVRMTSTQEKKWLEEVAKEYSLDTKKILHMINDEKVSDFNFWNMFIRAAAFLIVGATIFCILLLRIKFKRKV